MMVQNGPSFTEKEFLWKPINIILIYLLSLYIMKNLQEFPRADEELFCL